MGFPFSSKTTPFAIHSEYLLLALPVLNVASSKRSNFLFENVIQRIPHFNRAASARGWFTSAWSGANVTTPFIRKVGEKNAYRENVCHSFILKEVS